MTTTISSIDIVCPDWCTRTDHAADEITIDRPPLHYAADIGMVEPQSDGTTHELFVMDQQDDNHFLTITDPAVARQLSADLLRGAQWLDARRQEMAS